MSVCVSVCLCVSVCVCVCLCNSVYHILHLRECHAVVSLPTCVQCVFATHNEDSVRLVVQEMRRRGLKPDDGQVVFGQLLGMCDHVSYTLASHGYKVFKVRVVPFAMLPLWAHLILWWCGV